MISFIEYKKSVESITPEQTKQKNKNIFYTSIYGVSLNYKDTIITTPTPPFQTPSVQSNSYEKTTP
jgi:hypothetical protein